MSEIVYSRIKENEGLIYTIASKYIEYYNMDDLYQAGCIGIIKASKNFNSDSNVKFSTYAYKYILGEIVEFIKKDRNIIVSDEVYTLYKKYLHIKELLFVKYEREATFGEICSFMQIDEKYMLSIVESISFARSMDDDNISNSFSTDNRENIDNEIMIKDGIEKLNDFDKSLITYRYYQGYSQDETAKMLGISQAKASRQEKLILSKIKDSIAI